MQFSGATSPKTPRNVLVSKLVVQETNHTSHFEFHICNELSVLDEGEEEKEEDVYGLFNLFIPYNQPIVFTLRSI